MGKVAGRFVIILNIVKVLSVDEIASLASVTDNGSRLSEAAGVAA
ncbi:MAG: hypothetical protein AW07_02992 [Candidatus Accumulibacter sp. SK-11]|nr:MAG: hypothetical protein AW07_02992 [Candidatus Accumulibacter sp. SK-11]